jgi:hypothetical protein
MTKDSIKTKIKAFFSRKIELRLPTFGKPAVPDSFIFYSPTSDRTYKIEKNFVSSCSVLPESGRLVSFLTPQEMRSLRLANLSHTKNSLQISK